MRTRQSSSSMKIPVDAEKDQALISLIVTVTNAKNYRELSAQHSNSVLVSN